MKTVIVYYSLGGFTKKIAQQLAAKTGADLLRLTPVKEYPNEGAKKRKNRRGSSQTHSREGVPE